ncbi:SPOR domain-containing protein [Marinomonas sp. 5E14-1]|uniref:SPOR domain-containing protein n=1 Tax=Marinomonas sp. 5E14-1 TaxID=3153922 RepID=UPI003264D318
MGIAKKLVLVIAGLSLGACSSVGEREEFLSFNDVQMKVREHDEKLKNVQPTLTRIDVLEAEIADLKEERATLANKIEEIEHMAQSNMHNAKKMEPETSVSASKGVIKTDADKVEVTPLKPLKMETEALSLKEYGVQLAAYRTRLEVIHAWNQLKRNDSASFKGLEPRVYQKTINKRDMYQLKVGGFPIKSDAERFCNVLRKKGKDCFVTQYNGDSFYN